MHINSYSVEEAFSLVHDLSAPFILEISSDEKIAINHILRLLPGKRLVASALYHGNETVLLKIFRKQRYMSEELKGYSLLTTADIRTPYMKESRVIGGVGLCIYNYLPNLISFSQQWNACEHLADRGRYLDELLDLISECYSAGIMQNDIHLDNYAFYSDSNGEYKIYALDPAGYNKVDREKSKLSNLGLFISQFPIYEWNFVCKKVIRKFCINEVEKFNNQAHSIWRKRLRKILKKIYRECSYVTTWSRKVNMFVTYRILCVREQCSYEMSRFLESTDRPPEGIVSLKKGNSSIVWRTTLNNLDIVVKNSRNKDIWRMLRRWFKRSRANNSWYFSHMLRESGVNVATPIAMIEKKIGPLVIESWYLSTYVDGSTLLDEWSSRQPHDGEVEEVRKIINAMRILMISHGDFKASNFLLSNGGVYVLDYDGMQKHLTRYALDNALENDLKRFFRNWPEKDIKSLICQDDLMGFKPCV